MCPRGLGLAACQLIGGAVQTAQGPQRLRVLGGTAALRIIPSGLFFPVQSLPLRLVAVCPR